MFVKLVRKPLLFLSVALRTLQKGQAMQFSVDHIPICRFNRRPLVFCMREGSFLDLHQNFVCLSFAGSLVFRSSNFIQVFKKTGVLGLSNAFL